MYAKNYHDLDKIPTPLQKMMGGKRNGHINTPCGSVLPVYSDEKTTLVKWPGKTLIEFTESDKESVDRNIIKE